MSVQLFEGDAPDETKTGTLSVSVQRGRDPWGVITFEVGDGCTIRIEMKTNAAECVLSGLHAMRGAVSELVSDEFAARALLQLVAEIDKKNASAAGVPADQ